MFNALLGMGAQRQALQNVSSTEHTANNTNTAIYASMTVFSLLGGGIINLLGVRLPLLLSGLTYALNTGSYIYAEHRGPSALPFVIVSAVLMGVGAGVLWSGQGMVVISYPKEYHRGRFTAFFWVLFNLGGVIGAAILFGISRERDSVSHISLGAYIAILAVQCLGSLVAFALIPPARVVRRDGAYVTGMQQATSGITEARQVLRMFVNPWLLAFLPMSFASNFFYTYRFNQYNARLFWPRTRGFNNIFYWAMQSAGAFAVSLVLDRQAWPRRRRALIAVALITVLYNAVWLGTLMVEVFDADRVIAAGLYDIGDQQGRSAAGAILVYAISGACDAVWQVLAYWFIGNMASDPQIAARYVSFYKCVQSLGSVVAWQLDSRGVRPLVQLIVNWALIDFSLPFMFYISARTKDTLANYSGPQSVDPSRHSLVSRELEGSHGPPSIR
ncbi:hypothetical protein EV182_004258 [Spiromyces aspiralis]|uniref:Uncharacterized protein n=1 Tax=Spiromyces aspiralis TaxID=68401 RepID=A0ACC1HD86_9FUNG|nr:hypothetical protein EV182_004258 [Spiromyces aspiralis]